MSAFNEIDMVCQKCQEEFRGTVWTAVHAGVDPELKDLLLGGELNMVMCPNCAQVFFHEHFLIYQDPAEELVAYVYPETQMDQRDMLEKMMRTGFKDAQETMEPSARLAYDPLLFFGLESLVEMLHQEQDLIDQGDVAEAVCREHAIQFKRLSPAQSRQKNLPRIIPSAAARSFERNEVLAGLQKLIKEDPALTAYADLASAIEKKPAWSLVLETSSVLNA
jgi:hypothetical protein